MAVCPGNKGAGVARGDPSDLIEKPLQRGESGAERRSPTPQPM